MNNYVNIKPRWERVCAFIERMTRDWDGFSQDTEIDLEFICEALEKVSAHPKEQMKMVLYDNRTNFLLDFHAKCMRELVDSGKDVKQKITDLILQGEKAIADKESGTVPSVSNAYPLPRMLEEAIESIDMFREYYRLFEHGIDTFSVKDNAPRFSNDQKGKIQSDFFKLGYHLGVKENSTRRGDDILSETTNIYACLLVKRNDDINNTSNDCDPDIMERLYNKHEINTFNDCVPETLKKLYAKLQHDEDEIRKGELFV